MGPMLPPIRAPLMKTPIGSASPALSSRTLTHVLRQRRYHSGAGRRTDTARRADGDATASSLISWTLFPLDYGRIASLVKQEQLRAPLPLRAQLKVASAVFRH